MASTKLATLIVFLGGGQGSPEHVLGVAADAGGSLCVRVSFGRIFSGWYFCKTMPWKSSRPNKVAGL